MKASVENCKENLPKLKRVDCDKIPLYTTILLSISPSIDVIRENSCIEEFHEPKLPLGRMLFARLP